MMSRDLEWYRQAVQKKRQERANLLEALDHLDGEIQDLIGDVRALADELDPPTEPATEKLDRAVDTALAWDAERILTTAERKATAEDLDRWAQGREPLIPDVVNGKLHLRQAGRSWPAACEMCGAGNGQPCQAVSE